MAAAPAAADGGSTRWQQPHHMITHAAAGPVLMQVHRVRVQAGCTACAPPTSLGPGGWVLSLCCCLAHTGLCSRSRSSSLSGCFSRAPTSLALSLLTHPLCLPSAFCPLSFAAISPTGKKKKSLADFAIVRRIHFIFERSVRKFKTELGLWTAWLEFCRGSNSNRRLGRVVARALQIHPTGR